MWFVVVSILFLGAVENILENDFLDNNEIRIEHYVYWPNGTVPFYINPQHFDHEQSSIILTALTMFAYKTCLKFLPALEAPTGDHHVLVIENPNGVRQCVLSSTGHARDEPHYMILGYDCLQSPQLDMMLMKALGFGFEHNRAIRDLYISVQKENIHPSAMDLFAKDDKLPFELRSLPYDLNSAIHFGEREYSKNGHRTIIILDHKAKQCREGLSEIDLRKIDIVYGPECRKRDRLEKIDLCQGYPGVARRKRAVDNFVRVKREVEPTEVKSLRVNPDITPPPDLLNKTNANDVTNLIAELGIKDGVEEIVDLVYKLGSKALTNTRNKFCNVTTNTTEVENKTESARRSGDKKPDIFGVVQVVAEYVKDMVDDALTNLTAFCQEEGDFRAYQRQRCNLYSGSSDRCPVIYRSTKSGPVMYSTKHRPYIRQSTKHHGAQYRPVLYHQGRRDDNPSETPGGKLLENSRKKRDLDKEESGNANNRMKREVVERRFEGRRYNVRKGPDTKWEGSDISMDTNERNTKKKKSLEGDIQKDSKENKEVDRSEKKKFKSKGPVLPKTVELSKKNKEFYGERMWPDGVVRYIVTEDKKYDLADLRRRLDAVNRILKERTCVVLEEITEEDAERFEDYLVLDTSADYITGRVGGRQNFGSLELFEGGQHKQHTAMMVMAMLGFYFELARHDRDAHVRVHMRHVRADKLHHFEKIRSDATLPLPYDYESATHPAWQFWRKIGRTGISTVATFKEKDPDGSVMRKLGQHDQLLSDTDIIKINTVYGVNCFKKKPKQEVDYFDIGLPQVEEVGELKYEHQNLKLDEREKPKTLDRNKHRGDDDRHRDDERYVDTEDRGRNRDSREEHGRYRDREDHGGNREEERGRNGNREEHGRNRYREEHGRNRDRHRNKQGLIRHKELDNREYDRDRYRHEKNKRIDRYRMQGRYIDKHRKRPRKSDEDREQQSLNGKYRNMEKFRDRYDHKGFASHNRDRNNGKMKRGHGRYENRYEESSNRNQRKDKINILREGVVTAEDVGTEVEEVIVYREDQKEDIEKREEEGKKIKDQEWEGDGGTHMQMRKAREQIFAPVKIY